MTQESSIYYSKLKAVVVRDGFFPRGTVLKGTVRIDTVAVLAGNMKEAKVKIDQAVKQLNRRADEWIYEQTSDVLKCDFFTFTSSEDFSDLNYCRFDKE